MILVSHIYPRLNPEKEVILSEFHIDKIFITILSKFQFLLKEVNTVNTKPSRKKIEYSWPANPRTLRDKPTEISERIARVRNVYAPMNRPPSIGMQLAPAECFGIELGAMRRRAGLTLDDLASGVGTDENTILAIELGIAPVDVVVLHLDRIKNCLGDNSNYLDNRILNLMLDQ